MDRTAEVVVVGAGLAGLVAADKLVAAGVDVLVLEARDRVGGRLESRRIDGGAVVDLGGQWIGPGQTNIAALLADLGVETFPTHDEGRHLVHFDGDLRRYRGTVPPLGVRALADVAVGRAVLDRQVRRVLPDAPWTAAHAARADSETFASWIHRHLRTSGGRRFFRAACQAVFAAEPEDMSTLWVQAYLAANGGLDTLLATTGGAQQDRLVLGAGGAASRLAQRLSGRVVLQAPVEEVHWSEGEVVVTASGSRVTARRAILTLPPVLAGRVRYRPELPVHRRQLMSRMPMGSVVKVMTVYEEPFWRADGLSGQAASDRLPLGVVFDNSPPGGEPGVLVAFFEGRAATAAMGLDADRRRDLALDCLVTFFGPRAAAPVQYLERDWSAEPFSGGGYSAFAVPGTLTRYGPALRDPVATLHWAGTETAVQGIGYMDGAVESGHRAAREVKAALRPVGSIR